MGQQSTPLYAVGVGPGGTSTVNVLDASGNTVYSIDAFPGFTGGVRTAVADVNGDGTPDLIVGTGPGIATSVKIFDGSTKELLFTLEPFEASFTGGVFVTAGDVNGDGFADIVITPDEGGGPRARVFSGNGFAQIADFFGIQDANFRGGARAAFGDLNADGIVDLLVVAGFGGGPRVAGFDGISVATGTPTPEKLFADFFIFEQSLSNGVFITSGDLNGDGNSDIIAGGGPGGGPRVFALSGADILNGMETPLANFFAGDPENRGGVRLTAKNLDGDDLADLVVGAGNGAGTQLTRYLGKDITPNGTPPEHGSFDAFPGFTDGIFVG